MSNVLSDEKKNQILAWGGLGWSLRRIQTQTGVRRETAAGCLRPAGLAFRGRGRPEREWNPKPVDDWGKLLGDNAAVTALLDRLRHHAHILKCGPRSWRTKTQADLRHAQA